MEEARAESRSNMIIKIKSIFNGKSGVLRAVKNLLSNETVDEEAVRKFESTVEDLEKASNAREPRKSSGTMKIEHIEINGIYRDVNEPDRPHDDGIDRV